MSKIAAFILRLHGWRHDLNIPKESNRSVMIAAPHTSNWDFYFMMLAFWALKVPVRFTIKNSWTKFPFGLITKPIGAISIDRSPKKPNEPRRSYVDSMIDIFKKYDRIAVAVTPEGTRSLRKEWKMGFYHTAVGAGVPITFGYLDFKKKRAGVGGVVYPTGDIAEDFKVINNFYREINPKHPELWSLDERYDAV